MPATAQSPVASSHAYMAQMYNVPEIVITRVCEFVSRWKSAGVYASREVLELVRMVVQVET